MSSLNIATQIPNTINSLEKIHAWSGIGLSLLYPTLEAVEGPGINERVAQAGTFYVPSDNRYRLLIRSSFVLSPDYLAGGDKMWTYVQDFGNSALPQLILP